MVFPWQHSNSTPLHLHIEVHLEANSLAYLMEEAFHNIHFYKTELKQKLKLYCARTLALLHSCTCVIIQLIHCIDKAELAM